MYLPNDKGGFVCKYKAPELSGIMLVMLEAYNSATYSRNLKHGTFDVASLISCMDIYGIPEDYQHMMLEIMSEFEPDVIKKVTPKKK